MTYTSWNRLPHGPIRFQGTIRGKLQGYRAWLPGHQALLLPGAEDNPADRFATLWKAKGKRPPLLTLKQSGQPAFVTWDSDGFARPKTGDNTVYGFFWQDMNYLSHFTLAASDGQKAQPLRLVGKSTGPDTARYRYATPDGLAVERQEQLRQNTLTETLTVQNNGKQPMTVQLALAPGHLDLFEARWKAEDHALSPLVHTTGPAQLSPSEVVFTSIVKKRVGTLPENTLQTRIHLDGSQPVRYAMHSGRLQIALPIEPGATETLLLAVTPHNAMQTQTPSPESPPWTMPTIALLNSHGQPAPMQQVMHTAAEDLRQLLIPIPVGKKTCYVPAAGSPYFIALFGRDSLITSWQMLPWNPQVARDTLQVLARYQGKQTDPFTEEEPGKILHELRQGELTRLGVSPHRPYYGTVDATPLFVMLLAETVERTGDTQLLNQLWPNLEGALGWIDAKRITQPGHPLAGFLAQRFGDPSHIEGPGGLKNIGWKDSGTSMRHLLKGGKLHDPVYPLALAEVQAYVYGAWQGAAKLYRLKAQTAEAPQREALLRQADRLTQQARELKKRFNQAFWLPEKQFVATALQANGQPLDSVASNGAQALATGIVEADKVRRMVPRLLQDDMLSGWGVRTLSRQEPAFDPCSYHNGSIWPHDNWLMALGLKRSGYPQAAAKVIGQVLAAAQTYPRGRLPELFTGFQREKHDKRIVDYAETCIPQAWASGTPLGMLSTLLGLEIDGANRQLTFHQPQLPKGVTTLTLNQLPITPTEQVDLRLERHGNRITIHQTAGPPRPPHPYGYGEVGMRG